jgi:hypothetical protein
MEKFLEAAKLAWNPVAEVRRRLDAGTLTVSAVLIPVTAAVIACNLFRMTAWSFFWDTALHAVNPNVPKLTTSNFVVQFGSTVGVLTTAVVLALVPTAMFRPYGRNAVIAALMIVWAGEAFYGAAIGAPVYFVAGSFAFDNLSLGLETFRILSPVMAVAVAGLTLVFWCRVSLSILKLGMARMIGTTLVVIVGFGMLTGVLLLLASMASSASAGPRSTLTDPPVATEAVGGREA